MPYLPHNTSLGTLVMVEVYEFYDRPILFTCRNTNDVLYLVILTDDSDEGEVWMYVQLSRQRWSEMRTGAIDLRDTFLHSETGSVFQVQTFYAHPQTIITPIGIEDLDAESLPDAGERIRMKATP